MRSARASSGRQAMVMYTRAPSTVVNSLLIGASILWLSPMAMADGYLVDGKPVTKEVYQAVRKVNQSRDLLRANQLDKAEESLREALTLAPDLPMADANLGLVLARLGKPQEAAEHLEKAISHQPELAPAYVSLGGLYQSCGRIQDAIRVFSEYLRRFPHSEYADRVASSVILMKNELKARASQPSATANPMADNYIQEATRRRTIRWKSVHMPLKVYVKPGTGIPGFRPNFPELLTDAFQEWSAASGGKITFQFIDQAAAADIQCSWTNDVSQIKGKAEGGEARILPGPDGIRKATIVLLTLDPTPDRPLTDNLMHWICLHEIGHGLGILDHSTNQGDIMYFSTPVADTKRDLSQRDVNTLAILYAAND